VGYVVRRTASGGKIRYTAMYRDVKGRLRSAGTFTTERLAARAWQRAEADLAAGRIGDPKRGRQTRCHCPRTAEGAGRGRCR